MRQPTPSALVEIEQRLVEFAKPIDYIYAIYKGTPPEIEDEADKHQVYYYLLSSPEHGFNWELSDRTSNFMMDLNNLGYFFVSQWPVDKESIKENPNLEQLVWERKNEK